MKKLLVGIMLVIGLMSVGCKKVDLSEGLNKNMDDETFIATYVDNVNKAIDRTKYKYYDVVLDESNGVHEIIVEVNDKEGTLDKETADMYLNTIKGIKENLNDMLYKYDKLYLQVCITVRDKDNAVWTWTNDKEDEVMSYLTVNDNGKLIEYYGGTEEEVVE